MWWLSLQYDKKAYVPFEIRSCANQDHALLDLTLLWNFY